MKTLRLAPSCLPTRVPLNTALWWLLAVEVYKMPWWLEALGWTLFGFFALVLWAVRHQEERIDIFEKYRERKVAENEKT